MPSADWPSDLHPVRGLMSVPQVLVENGGVVLLDTGFPTDGRRIRAAIQRLGFTADSVRAILLTHGHVDHAGSAAELKDWCGARVYAHPAEQAHIDGTHGYRGLARVTGALERAGRDVTRYRPVKIDVALGDGDELPFWGGL